MDAGTAIAIFLGAALAVFSVCLVGYSLVRGRNSGPADQKRATRESATPEGDDPALGDIFDAIRTLELEYQLGRLSQEEFQAQFQAYRVQAATVLREQLEAGRGDPAWVLEQEILLARGTQERANSRTIGSAKEMTIPCPDCSAAVPNSAGNCPHCNAAMAPRP